MADKPIHFPNPILQAAAMPATANTAVDGTGTTTELARGSASKIRKVDRINLKALLTTTATQISLFFSSDGGTTKRFFKEISLPEITRAAGTPSAEGVWYAEGFVLENDNCRIYGAPYTAHAVNSIAEMFEP